jgi:PAS domain S-box-containing protein
MKTSTGRGNTERKNILPVVAGLGTALFLLCAALFIIFSDQQRQLQSERLKTIQQMSIVRARLEGALNSRLQLTKSLVSFITINGDISHELFQTLAVGLVGKDPVVRNIALLKKTTIIDTYPIKGNEKAIGVDLSKIPAQRDTVLKAIDTRQAVIAGPVNLVQGGIGIIYRVPIFLTPRGKPLGSGAYWGQTSMVIMQDVLFAEAGIGDESFRLNYAIRGRDGLGAQGAIFLGDENIFLSSPVILDVNLPGGSWQMAALPAGGWASRKGLIGFLLFLGAVTSSFAGWMVWSLLKNRETLQQQLRVQQSLMEDLKEQRLKAGESEANYRSVVENIQDVFYRSDTRGNLIMTSPSFLTLLGYASFDDCLGKPIAASFYYDPEKRAALLREIQSKGSVTNYEVVLKRKDGTPVMVETSSHFYLDAAGNIAGVEGIFQDITQRKQAEDAHRKLENQLIQAQKMEAIGTLAGGIAHDFNNILSGIIGYSELCLKAVQDRPKVRHNMEQVIKAGERAKELIQQILAFSRKAVQEKKPIALAAIIKEVVRFMRASLPTTIQINQTIDETSDVIMADLTQMHQVLMNMCTNAGHAMKETGGVLEIGLKEVAVDAVNLIHHPALKSGRYLELSVRDTGQGIPQENLGRIFDPYFTTKKTGEGTGLGLAVVHGIVKDHGGDLSVYSEVGKGTIFSIYLPLKEKQAEADRKVEEVVLRGKGETILFIDDEKMVVDFSRELLEELGYRVVTETDPVGAIEVFKNNSDNFDIVITDKTMPRLTGFDVIRKIRAIRADIPVVLCSGYQDKEDMEKLQALGINQLITKPVRMIVLAKAIRDILDKDQP